MSNRVHPATFFAVASASGLSASIRRKIGKKINQATREPEDKRRPVFAKANEKKVIIYIFIGAEPSRFICSAGAVFTSRS